LIKYLKPKEFRRLHSNDCCGICKVEKNGKYIIEVPYHVSTATRLHELAHQINNDNGSYDKTIEQFFDKEIKAELFVYQHMNRELTIRIVAISALQVAELIPNNSNYILKVSKDKMKQYNIPTCEEEISSLWGVIKLVCKETKQKRNNR
jgi:hypothetical protein